MQTSPTTTADVHAFRVGVRLGCGLAVAIAAYLALTPHGPHRQLLALMLGGGSVLAVSVAFKPVVRLIERGNRDVLMLVWCATFVVLAALLSVLDGGLRSPFVSIFFVSVAFAATALPRSGVIAVSTLNVLGLAAVALHDLVADGRHPAAFVLTAAGLVATAVVGATVSADRARRVKLLRRSQEEVVRRLARVVEYRDNDTGEHIERMSRYSAMVAEALGWAPGEARKLQLAATLHDVGKVAVPDAILLKPGRLSADERTVIERHCRAGFDMLSGSASDLLDLAATIALTHHERYDGAGYPSGLAGEAIPLAGRIVSVADVFDALTSDRVYKAAMGVDAALEIILEGRGTQFDPRVVDAFVSRFAEIAEQRAHAAPREPVAAAA
jgi:hypothetical protein